jgi:hypothetical protein
MTVFSKPSGGLNPLGTFSITAGTPVPLNENVTAQAASGQKPAYRYQQIIISCPASNTEDVLLMFTGGKSGLSAAGDPNNVLAAISPGRSIPFPNGLLINSKIDIDNYALDTDGGTQAAYGCAVYG